MGDNFLSGKAATVAVGYGTAPNFTYTSRFAFDHWKLTMKSELPKISNISLPLFQLLIPGMLTGTCTLEGPYNQGNMLFIVGDTVGVRLYFTDLVGLQFYGVVESIEPDVKAEDADRLSVTIQSSGVFTAAIDLGIQIPLPPL